MEPDCSAEKLSCEFVNRAKKWEGTPYVHQANKSFGCDCSGLVVGLLEEMGYDMSGIDLPDRPARAIDDRLVWQVEKIATLGGRLPEVAEPGDLILFALGGHVQHIAIKIEGDLMLHADRYVGETVAVRFPGGWTTRIYGIYRINWNTLTPRICPC
jgi:cell wall-associated NlpC family hydrolase